MGGMQRTIRGGLRARRSRRGFTLIELMIAVSVLVVAVLTTFETQLASHRLVRTSRETNAATADLATAMEELLLLPRAQIPIAGSDFEAGQPIAAFEGRSLRDERIVATYPDYVPGGAVPDPLAVVLTATWTDHGGRTRSLRIASMRTQ
jgi:prepilin-type N-terminal cleavage/methylation domain-containing protein